MTPISIVIITLNEAERIGNILRDLAQQSYQNFEVIVVDSNSEDDTCQIAASFRHQLPAISVHKMSKRGVSLGRNTGASLAKNERILFLDADVQLDADFLKKASQLLDKKSLKVAGVYMNADHLKPWFTVGYQLFNMGIFVSQFLSPTAVGACIFSSKSVHEQLGGFDESITLCEDCDYVNRAKKITRYQMLPLTFRFDPRRLQQDGYFNTGWKYLHANLYRFFMAKSAITKSVTSLGIIIPKKNSVGVNAIFCRVFRSLPYTLSPFKLSRTLLHKGGNPFFKVFTGRHLHLVNYLLV